MRAELKTCAWVALVGMIAIFVGMVPLAHIIPPPAPSLGPQEIAATYAEHSIGIRLAGMLLIVGATFLIPFYVAISAAMLKMQPRSLVMSAIQLMSGTIGILPLFYAGFFFAATTFRPDRSPELIQLASDIAWFMIIVPAPSILPQLVVLGIAILRDRSAKPVFPRWIAYLNFWTVILFQPGLLAPLFMHGPFAWNGLLAFWVPILVFGNWIMAMWWAVLKFANSPAAEAQE